MIICYRVEGVFGLSAKEWAALGEAARSASLDDGSALSGEWVAREFNATPEGLVAARKFCRFARWRWDCKPVVFEVDDRGRFG